MSKNKVYLTENTFDEETKQMLKDIEREVLESNRDYLNNI